MTRTLALLAALVGICYGTHIQYPDTNPCILLDIETTNSVTWTNKDGKTEQSGSWTFGTSSPHGGDCGTSPNVKVTWPDISEFNFTFKEAGSMVELDMTFTFTPNYVFSNSTDGVALSTKASMTLGLPTKAFTCSVVAPVKFDFTGNNNNKYKATFNFKSIKAQGFNVKDGKYSEGKYQTLSENNKRRFEHRNLLVILLKNYHTVVTVGNFNFKSEFAEDCATKSTPEAQTTQTSPKAPTEPPTTEPPVTKPQTSPPTSEPPSNSTTEPPIKPTTEPPSNSTTGPPIKPTTEPPSNSTTEPPTKPTTEPPTTNPASSTMPPPSPTTAPTPNLHPSEKFTVFNKNKTDSCVYMVGEFLFAIPYQKNDSNATAQIGVQDIANVTGTCNGTGNTNTLIVSFYNDWKMEIVFKTDGSMMLGDDSDKNFWWSSVKLDYVYHEDLMKDLKPDMENKAASAMAANQTLFKSSRDSSYLCNAAQTINLDNAVSLTTYNMQYDAFHTGGNQTKFDDDPTQCSEDEKTNSIVPIAVGAALAGLVVIVLIAYLIGRRRNRKGYESV